MLKLINQFRKTSGYQINTWKSVMFLYTKNKILERETKEGTSSIYNCIKNNKILLAYRNSNKEIGLPFSPRVYRYVTKKSLCHPIYPVFTSRYFANNIHCCVALLWSPQECRICSWIFRVTKVLTKPQSDLFHSRRAHTSIQRSPWT